MNWTKISDLTPDFGIPILVAGEGKVFIARLESIVVTADSKSYTFLEGSTGYDELYITPTHFIKITYPN